MKKAALRKIFLEKRREMDSGELERRSRLIRNLFFASFPPGKFHAVHIFLPIKKQKEVDVSGIIEGLRSGNPATQIIVSKSNLATLSMESFLYTPGIRLRENEWGIPEPVDAGIFPEKDIDMVVVPLLAFDRIGHRVGYGKGFYDRFLVKCRPDALKVGLSLEPPVDRIPDCTPYDVRLDYCITPGEVYHFSGG